MTVIFFKNILRVFHTFFCHPPNNDIFGEKVFCLNVTKIYTYYDNKNYFHNTINQTIKKLDDKKCTNDDKKSDYDKKHNYKQILYHLSLQSVVKLSKTLIYFNSF